MSHQRKILLPLLVASLVLLLTGVPCNSFAPLSYNPPVTTLSCSTLSHPPTLFVGSNHPRHSIVSQVAAAREGGGGTVHENSDGNNDDATAAATTTKPNLNNFLKQRRMGKEVIGSAFLALTLSLSPSFSNAAITYDDPLHHPSTPTATISSTILLSRGTLLPPDDVVIAELTLQTKEIEREAAKDKKRADVEKSIAAFFDYDARMAEEQEARIEAAEFRAEAEASYDKEQAELLKIEERKAEKEFRAAQTPQEKRSSAMKARVRNVIHHVLYSHWGNICIVLLIFLTLNLNQSFFVCLQYICFTTQYITRSYYGKKKKLNAENVVLNVMNKYILPRNVKNKLY